MLILVSIIQTCSDTSPREGEATAGATPWSASSCSIRVPCPYASSHGYGVPRPGTPSQGRARTRRATAPARRAASSAPSAAALLNHFVSGAHNWPCTTKVRAGKTFSVRLHDGFNFFLTSSMLIKATPATTRACSCSTINS
jgi:hypothetical protein